MSEAQKLKGKFSISRPSYGGLHEDKEVVVISLVDDLSGAQCVEIEIGLADFARALTGLGHLDCEFEWRPKVVGMKAEAKYEVVPFDWSIRRDQEDVIGAALAPFEVDGWRARRSDLFNHHNRAAGGAQRVLFTRHLPVTGEAVKSEEAK